MKYSRENERISTLRNILDKSFNKNEDPRKNSLMKYLDIGCGDGNITHKMGEFLKCNEIYGADIFTNSNSVNEDINYIQIENSLIPLPDNSIDFISCFVCIHHFSNIEMMFAEICRVMKPGGFLYIRDHDIKNTRDYVLVNLIHILYGAKDLTYYEGSYFSLHTLLKYLTNIGFSELTTLLYPPPNPQKIYHTLFRYNTEEVKFLDDEFKLFDDNFDTVEWLNKKNNRGVTSYIKDIVQKKLQRIYKLNIYETRELMSRASSEKELYDILCSKK